MCPPEGHFCHDPHQLETPVMTTELRTKSHMLKSSFSPSGPPWLPHIPHRNFTVSLTLATSHYPKHPSLSRTLYFINAATFVWPAFLPPPPIQGPVQMSLLHEVSRSTKPAMSPPSTERPQFLGLCPPHGALRMPKLTILMWGYDPSVLLALSFLITKLCFNVKIILNK